MKKRLIGILSLTLVFLFSCLPVGAISNVGAIGSDEKFTLIDDLANKRGSLIAEKIF